LIGCLIAANGCVLRDYRKVGSDQNQQESAGSGTAALNLDGGPMAPDGTLPGASAECNTCIAQSCAEQLSECGTDCADLSIPISPATAAPGNTAPFLACLQQQCESTCHVTWGCVKKYRWPAAPAPYTIDLRVNDLIQADHRLTSAHASACLSSDPGCTAGSGRIAEGMTDAVGHVLLTVPRDFVGYFLVKSTDDYMPTLGLWSQPAYLVDNARTQPMISWAVADYLGSSTGTVVDRQASHLIFQVLNCLPLRFSGNAVVNSQAEDVQITYTYPAENSSQVFYTITGSVIDRSRDRTSASGSSYGGVINLRTQTTTITAHYEGMEVSRAAVQMQAGTVAFVYMLPDAR
jgi:hypothetical protein